MLDYPKLTTAPITLRDKVNNLLRKLSKQDDKDKLQEAWDSYGTALALSRGADSARAIYWAEQRDVRFNQLTILMDHLVNNVVLA